VVEIVISGELLDSDIVDEGEEDVCDVVLLHEHGGDLTMSKSNLAPVPLKHEDIYISCCCCCSVLEGRRRIEHVERNEKFAERSVLR
jgi:hypothetical protein